MSRRIHVATRKGLFQLDRTSNGWSVERHLFPGVHCSVVLPDPRDGAIYVGVHHGHFGDKVHRSDDGGRSFAEVGTPVYPDQPEGEVDVDGSGRPLPWKLTMVWSFATGGRDDGGLWCGTIPGGLFRSTDRGATWELSRSLWDHLGRKEWFGGGADQPGIHSICVDPRDSATVRLGVSCGGVWMTEDDGASWNCRAEGMRAEYMPPDQANNPNIQDPHCLVQCKASPDHLWVQHHNGIFRSTDGSMSWTEIAKAGPSTFGFPVVVHPSEPDTAWFIPAVKDEVRIPVDGRLVVTRTRDGGRSFDVMTRGLPQEHAYDVVFRHAFDIDESGDRLAFGSTTGSLFVSEDQGDSWTCVSSHLPPVYAVRFEAE